MSAKLRNLLVGVFAVGGLASIVVQVLNGLSADDVTFILFGLAVGLVGSVLVLRVPENSISWILFAIALGLLVNAVAEFGSERLSNTVSGLYIFGLLIPGFGVMVPLLFPTGSPPSPRWRWVARTCAMAVLLIFGGLAIVAWVEGGDTQMNVECTTLGGCVSLVGSFALLTSALAAVTSLVVRWRRSSGVERAQLRWLVPSFVILLVGQLAEFGGAQDSWVASVFGIGLILVPISIGLAITRYRLYEIDRIVSRTVSYALVVGLLVAAVAGVATLAGSRFQEPWLVAATTLGVAALFNPLKRQVQGLVDRRFNRSRYDAELVIEEFTSTLQDEVEASGVTEGWLAVVDRTMQPASMGVWVRG
jgi:MFS family permease